MLGLIFEKINGYRDGSFYTPGFITMYMARHTLRRAVLQHFERRYGFGATTIAALYEKLPTDRRPEFSAHFNALTVLDPAVGSGHFLVSALNELLAIKAELGLLLADDGQRLRYRLTVARDELVVQHEDDDPTDPSALFQYQARLDPLTGARTVAPAHTNLQRALFREKRHLIEHALFGVDLNPNSVRICRLRLWIELLKHTYYLPETGHQQLETLPNLDLNIKPGNSLLSRFALGADLSDVFRQGKFTLQTYRDAVHAYFNTRDREAKQRLQRFLGEIKEQFTETIYQRDPLRRTVTDLKNQKLRVELDAKPDMFGKAKISKDQEWEKLSHLKIRLEKAEAALARREQGLLYRDAFEWRFEFPEVLNDQGEFRGFDVLVGNPPYLQVKKGQYPPADYVTYNTFELFAYFFERGQSLLTKDGILAFITSSLFIKGPRYDTLRNLLTEKFSLIELSNRGDGVFKDAKIPTAIFIGKSEEVVQEWQFSAEMETDEEDSKGTLGSISDIQRGLEIGRKIMLPHTEGNVAIISGSDVTKYEVLKKRQITEATRKQFAKDEKYFAGERILIRETGSELTCVYLSEHLYCNRSLYSIKITHKDYDTKYVCAVLNSASAQKIYSERFRSETNIFPKIRIEQARQLPIPPATPAEQAPIIALVEDVLAAKAAGEPTAALEAEIDSLVAARYGLTPAEAAQL